MIELLVVVAIIAVLASLLLPALAKARDAAHTAACLTQLRQMGMAMMVYATDHDGTLVYDSHLTSWTLTGHQFSTPTTGHLQDYLEGTPVYFDARPNYLPNGPGGTLYCPAYSLRQDVRGKYPFPGWEGRVPTNFQNMGPIHIARSYRQNDWLGIIPAYNSDGTPNNWNTSGQDKLLPKLEQIRSPSMLVLFGEGYDKNGFLGWNQMYFNPRHGDRSPAVRADGSVKLYTTAEAVGGSGVITGSPNHGVNSSFPVDTWGTYLHPSYTRPY